MKGVPQGRYTKEFREEAVKMVTEEKLSLPEAGRRLSLAPSTIASWVKAYKAGRLGEIGKTYRPLTDVEMDLARTRKELAEVKMERDILKKAAAYFARSRCPVRVDEKTAAQLPGTASEASIKRIGRRVLRLVRQAIIEMGQRGIAAGGRNQSGRQAHQAGLRSREITA